MYELKLSGGTVVTWPGASGEDAARRYVDCHRGTSVVAWRTAPGPVLSVLTRGAEIDGIRIAGP